MSGNRHSATVKKRAEYLRKSGKSYSEITRELCIPKSTLSVWLGEKYPNVFSRPEHLRKIRILAAAELRRRKLERISIANENGRHDASVVPIKNIAVLKSLIAMLYWAEGGKAERGAGVVFVNTDPELALLFLTLLRKCFKISESKIRIRLHVHHYHNKRKAMEFWSRLLSVPQEQFGKLHVKKRSVRKKFRQNFMGICFVIYHEARIRREIMALAREIGRKITSIRNT